MPSFYAGSLPLSHMPPTPEYTSTYTFSAHGTVQDASYGPYPTVGAHDLSSYGGEPYDPYKAVAPPSATLFPSTNSYVNSRPINATHGPPAHSAVRGTSRHGDPYHCRHATALTEHKSKEDQVVGGVSAKLDYEMETMTDFVAEMSCDVIKPGIKAPANFRKWVLHVLHATRLPSATILTSLHYLSIRVRDLVDKTSFQPSELTLYQLLTVALILGSKFLDDNTFQNKSWAEVSSIKVADLNRDEREWLGAFGHRLHYHPQTPEGFEHWQERWNAYQTRALTINTTLRPIDTNVNHRRSMHLSNARQNVSPSIYAKQYAKVPAQGYVSSAVEPHYSTPLHTPYDPWYLQRSANDRSPSTAPHTGPTTPEYYGAQGIWSQDYMQRGPFTYPAVPMVSPQPTPYHTSFNSPYNDSYAWNGHGPSCKCHHCPRNPPHYLMSGRYGPTVAG